MVSDHAVVDVAGTVLDDFPAPAWILSASGELASVNRAWIDFSGRQANAGQGDHWAGVMHPEDSQSASLAWTHALQSESVFERELRLLHHSGEYLRGMFRIKPKYTPGGKLTHWLGTFSNVQYQGEVARKLASDLKLRDDMLDVSIDCIKIIDPYGNLVHMNRSGCLALGVPVDETRWGMPWLELLSPDVRASGRRALELARSGRNARFPGKSGSGKELRHWDNLLTPLKDDSGETSLILCVSRDVTSQREVERRLRVASENDALTNLYNRRAFRSRMDKMMARARKRNASLGLLLIDLDHFKHINDTLGHPAGDYLLRTLSHRLTASLPQESTLIARLGGDEFAIVTDNVDHEQQVMQVADDVLRQYARPISCAGHVINGSMSIGAAMFPRDAEDASGLMTCADAALNDLKAGGRCGVRMFSAHMLRTAADTAEQFERARTIVRTDVIEPHYQPKVRLQDGSIIGLEALLRWRDAKGTLHLPATVVEAFHDYELATSMGQLMQTKVFADINAWREQGLRPVPVSINAAPVEFLRGDYADNLLKRMQRARVPAELVEIEVTEQMLLARGAEFIASALRTLKAHGVRVALDDFGTGQSSFVHLRDYPVDTLKIDMGFVSRMMEDPSNLAIVKAIAKLGPLLGIDVIAEGVETEAQRSILQSAECRLGQGFLFGAARSADETAKLLR